MNKLSSTAYLTYVDELMDKEYAITEAKNHDYSGTQFAFANFDMVEQLGICSAETGILVRMTDKMARVINLLKEGTVSKVTDESISDTLTDLSNYSRILNIYILTKREQGLAQESSTATGQGSNEKQA